MEEKLNETNVEAARVTPDKGFQLIKVNMRMSRILQMQNICRKSIGWGRNIFWVAEQAASRKNVKNITGICLLNNKLLVRFSLGKYRYL